MSRDGDYPVSVGVHLTRIYTRDEFSGTAYEELAATCGIQPTVKATELVELEDGGKVSRPVWEWPDAFVTCTCRWSRPAPSRVVARSKSFVHRQLVRMS